MKKSFYELAQELFPDSRNLTEEEEKSLEKYLDEISEPVTESTNLWGDKKK